MRSYTKKVHCGNCLQLCKLSDNRTATILLQFSGYVAVNTEESSFMKLVTQAVDNNPDDFFSDLMGLSEEFSKVRRLEAGGGTGNAYIFQKPEFCPD